MTRIALLGGAKLSVPPLTTLDASSATGLEVTRWAERPARLARMDRLCALALVACDAALVDAGLSPGDTAWASERWEIVLGSAFGSHATNEAYYRGSRSPEGASPRLFAYTLPSSPVGEITIHHRILGPSSTNVCGLTAGIDALREALRHLDAGRADRMLIAGADVATPMLGRLGYDQNADRAAALVITPHEATHRVTTASRFVAGNAASAARAAIAALGATDMDEVFASALVSQSLSVGSETRRVLDATVDAPLAALQTIARSTTRTALIVAADPSGQVSALRVERSA